MNNSFPDYRHKRNYSTFILHGNTIENNYLKLPSVTGIRFFSTNQGRDTYFKSSNNVRDFLMALATRRRFVAVEVPWPWW
jgi:hypothetical protein